MITKRLAILLVFMTVGFSGFFLLPKSPDQPVGVILKLPDYVGDWKGTKREITQKEYDVLGPSTEFARMLYRNPYAMVKDYPLQVTVVLSGSDMSNSIHRPERCLEAQGYNLLNKAEHRVRMGEDKSFPVSKLNTVRRVETSEGKFIEINSVTCYWFAGSDEMTADHWSRWFIDNRDRLLKGVNQRWAFVTVSGDVPRTVKTEDAEKARQWTEELILRFVAQMEPRIHGDSLQYQE